jgi:hypothetical protein
MSVQYVPQRLTASPTVAAQSSVPSSPVIYFTDVKYIAKSHQLDGRYPCGSKPAASAAVRGLDRRP